MTPPIDAIAHWLADFYLAATVLLLATAAVFAVDKQPARRRAVGWCTCLGLLLVATLSTTASYPRLHLVAPTFAHGPVAPEFEPGQSPPPHVAYAHDATSHGINESTTFGPSLVAPEQSPLRGQQPVNGPLETVSTSPEKKIVALVVGIYLAGTLMVGIWLSVGAWTSFRLMRRSTVAPARCVAALQEIVGTSTRPPRVLVNRSLLTAVAAGTVRPVILIPETVAEPGRPQEVKAVLLHEWAHIKNGDLWLLAVARFLMNLLWAHPLYWWLRRRLRADQEFLADAAAASEVGATDYAALLVEWARPLTRMRRLPGVGIWEARAGLAERVATILNQSDQMPLRCSGRARTSIVFSLTALSGLAAMLSLRPPAAESSRTDSQAPASGTTSALIAEHASTDISHLAADELGGTCVDWQKHPIAGAELLLYATNFRDMTQRFVQQTSTDASGRFKFAKLQPKDRAASDVVIARRRGLATFAGIEFRGKPLEISMRKAATFRGTVRDEKGKPLAGAQVSFATDRSGISCLLRRVDGVRSARTDAKGEFSVDDLEDFTYVREEEPPGWRGGWGIMGPPSMRVVRPDYVDTWVQYKKVPGSADVVLARAATIEGQVVFGESDKPAAGVMVSLHAGLPRQNFWGVAESGPDGRYRFDTGGDGPFTLSVSSAPGGLTAPFVDAVEVNRGRSTEAPVMRLVKGGEIRGRIVDDVSGRLVAGLKVDLQGIHEQKGTARSFFASTKSDASGQYQFTALPAGNFNIFLDDTGPDVTAAAIESLPVECSQTTAAPPIHLIRGGLLKGRVLDDATGKPFVVRQGEQLGVRIYGPTRPKSGGACHYAIVNKDGTFEMRLPPGVSSLLTTNLSGGQFFNPVVDAQGGEVIVPDGGEAHVEFRGTRFEMPKAPH